MGKLYVIGIGPGGAEYLTPQARAALDDAQIIFGYTVYIDLLAPLYPDKETVSLPMRQEVERCRQALETARSGRTAALICSGDPGVYGLAGLVFELAPSYPNTDVQIISGVTAATSGAALLGAPLGHDFCVISLSDLLTPWEVIETRLRHAAMGDFALCVYNPGSRRRTEQLRRACEILLEYRAPETVCGLTRNIGRAGESMRILTLSQLREISVDMFTTVFIGSSATREISGRMVTPRGYQTPTP